MNRYKDDMPIYVNGSALKPTPPRTVQDNGSIADWNSAIREKVEAGLLAAAYNDDVLKVLDSINKPGVGQALLEELQGLPDDLVIVITPKIKGMKDRFGDGNAMVIPDNQAKALAPNERLSTGDTPTNVLSRDVVGVGGGSSVLIAFNPNEREAACTGNPSGRQCLGVEPEEIMLHELVHALRDLEGKETNVSFNHPDQLYDNLEEFYAILLANIFSSERGKRKFRRDHKDTATPLKDEWASSAGFLSNRDSNTAVNKFCDDYPSLSNKIALVDTPFNPIRECKARRARTR